MFLNIEFGGSCKLRHIHVHIINQLIWLICISRIRYLQKKKKKKNLTFVSSKKYPTYPSPPPPTHTDTHNPKSKWSYEFILIIWMGFYRLKNWQYFNRKHSVVTDGVMALPASNQLLCNGYGRVVIRFLWHDFNHWITATFVCLFVLWFYGPFNS